MRVRICRLSAAFIFATLLTACGGTLEVGIERTLDAGVLTASAPSQLAEGAVVVEETTAVPTITLESTPSLTVAASPSDSGPQPPTESPSLTPTACGPPRGWVLYTVEAGDSLFRLSQKFNVTISELQRANCLTGTNIRAGQQLYVPFVPTPTPTFTATPSPTWTAEPQAIFAPGGKRYATNRGLVVDVEAGRVATVTTEVSPWVSFWKWTMDGRFAIFTRINQYGNGRMMVLDTQTWSMVLETTGCSSPTSICGEYPIALYSLGPRFLRADGWLTDLPARQTDLLGPWRTGPTLFVIFADWSPNAASMAFVTGIEGQTDFALYTALGDGTQIQRMPLDSLSQSLQWTSDSKSVVVTTTFSRYTLDVTTGELQITPLSTVTPSPSASATPTSTPSPTP